MLLGLSPGIDVVAAAVDGDDAVRLAAEHRPDVVLMDLRMPRCDGVAATRRILARLADTRVIVLTTYADDDSVFAALEAGARGYLTKDATAAQIQHAIRVVLAGEALLDPSVQRRLLERALAAPRARAASSPPPTLPDGLTQREAEVLREIADRAQQSRDRRTAVDQRSHRQDPREQHLFQSRSARPRPGRGVRHPPSTRSILQAMDFQDVVRKRRMVRSFERRPLPPEVVERILRNAQRAPSAGFSQGWAFLVLEGADRDATLLGRRRSRRSRRLPLAGPVQRAAADRVSVEQGGLSGPLRRGRQGLDRSRPKRTGRRRTGTSTRAWRPC